ncbi:transposase [Pantanalinema sp. GBBB05]|uniref:transposase n=1 Tax=Pantanalinema sp. GBBB05 TaxID=2604139 RepID=UPI001DBD7A03|nr:hypothetical protein [Pantanalinema sp. GBBB05]
MMFFPLPVTNYRRLTIAGGTYLFTLVTHQRRPWLCHDTVRSALRAAMPHVCLTYPFVIEAMILLPNNLHCIWTAQAFAGILAAIGTPAPMPKPREIARTSQGVQAVSTPLLSNG